MRKWTAAIVIALCATGVQAKGAFEDSADAIKYRQAAFGLIKENFADMGAMLKKKKPMDEKVFLERAQHLAMLAPIPFNGFKIEGSDKGDTDALPKVWSNHDEFLTIATKFQKTAQELAKTSESGDVKAMGKAFGAVAKNCKGCHDEFKAE